MDDLFRMAARRVQNLIQAGFGMVVLGLSWKATISLGNIPREIVAAAVGEKADLIVMAKRKRGILIRFFARSISEAVNERASCPMLSLRAPQIMQHRPSGCGAGFLGVQRGAKA